MNPSRFRARWTVPAVLLATFAGAAAAPAQEPDAPSYRGAEVFAGGEIEAYLRALQVGGAGGVYPWSLRSFSPGEVERIAGADSLGPWSERFSLRSGEAGRVTAGLIRPSVDARFNSAFPYGSNDGALWVGRGLTTSVQAGFYARYGPATLVVAPQLFRAENADFEIVDNGMVPPWSFGDRRPFNIDLPQRFGEGAYTRLDPGQSTLRLDALGLAAGVSTANQYWGPAAHYPLLLGNNAGGFPHLFAGTGRPLNVWIGRVHGRLMWGRLSESPYSTAVADSTVRFASGLVGVFTPRGLPNVEVGLGRFFHTPWTDAGIRLGHFRRPIEAIFKSGTGDPDDQNPLYESANQLASVFGRWTAPNGGFEVYGEFAREDHSWDLRDFIVQPDHNSGYTLGFGKVWRRGESGLVTLRGEVLNTRVSHLARVRHQAPFYLSSFMRQGHTHRGQILGAAAGYGGSGTYLGADYYHPGGRWSVSWVREVRAPADWAPVPAAGSDTWNALGAEALVFRGPLELTAGVTGVHEANRDFAGDEFNFRTVLGVRWNP